MTEMTITGSRPTVSVQQFHTKQLAFALTASAPDSFMMLIATESFLPVTLIGFQTAYQQPPELYCPLTTEHA
jgi:hypothetical protein